MKIKLTFLLFILLFLAVVSCETKEQKQEESPMSADNSVYLEKGQHIASSTFASLSGKLQAAMKEGGVINAVDYCNFAAFPLVDSLAKAHQADIRRTSLKVRNPENAPTSAERSILEKYTQSAQAGEALKPMVQQVDGQTVVFYAPIQINAFCLQCHGKLGDTLKEEDYDAIHKLYPDDQAVGYAEGDLRGIWSIRFKKDKKG